MRIKNKKLYEYIVNNYMTSKKITTKDVAEKFGLSMGAVKNFMYRHNLNKKTLNDAFKLKIRQFYYEGGNVNQIAKENGVTASYIYQIVAENYKCGGTNEKIKQL